MAKRTGKEILFHGGELSNEFVNAAFFHHDYRVARSYGKKLFAILIDWDMESVSVEDDTIVPDCDDWQCEMWREQTRQIEEAAEAGDTVLACDDGLAIINVSRLCPVPVTIEQAEAMVDAIDYDGATPDEAFALC